LFEVSDPLRVQVDSATGVLSTPLSYPNNRVHMLSYQSFTLPIYVECELKKDVSYHDTTILLGNSVLQAGAKMKAVYDTIVWGTTSYDGNRYSYAVNHSSGNKYNSNYGDVDPTSSEWTKFSIYVDENEVIMYQYDGVQKYRFTPDTTTFPSWAVAGGTVRVGIWDNDGVGMYRNLKVKNYNPWR